MTFLTDFADLGVVAPLAVAVALALALAGWTRGAIAWALVVPATLGAVLVIKLFLAACGSFFPLHGLHSPSGHTASAGAVYGGLLAILIARPRPGGQGRTLIALLLAGGFAVLTGASRLALHLHSRSDVLAGALIGVGGAVALVWLAGPRPARLRLAVPLAAALAAVVLFHGAHLHAEEHIDRLARLIFPFSLCAAPHQFALALARP
jgi:membrane-associated phospholipid phosphatase